VNKTIICIGTHCLDKVAEQCMVHAGDILGECGFKSKVFTSLVVVENDLVLNGRENMYLNAIISK
jgi:hypothetical protein